MEIILHSRHIPSEHLNFQTVAANTVKNNGLCDVLQKENLNILKVNGVSVIETRLTSYELGENNSNKWNRLRNAISSIKKARLKVGLFCWFQYPAENVKITKLQCLEHKETSSIASLWDKNTLLHYDLFYKELAENFKNEIDFLYVGIYGDYGEVCFPTGVNHYIFSPKHGHAGFFCNDPLARKDFSDYLQKIYNSITELNEAWGTSFSSWSDDLMPALPFTTNSLCHRADFAKWYTESISNLCESICQIADKYFPDTPKGLPIGHPDEKLCVGQIKSEIIKIAAKHNYIARWTGLAFLCNFGKSDVLAKRVSCPALFYGTRFGTEAALTLNPENTANSIYENLANGSQMLHNDLGNFTRGGSLWIDYLKNYKFSSPVYNAAVFYPVEGEMLEELKIESNPFLPFETKLYNTNENSIEKSFSVSFNTPRDNKNKEILVLSPIDVFITRAACLRHYFDYALTDSRMINDGFLKQIKILFFTISTIITQNTQQTLSVWLKEGGKIFLRKGIKILIQETGKPIDIEYAEYETPPEIEPYYSLRKNFGENNYYTIHKDFISSFNENTCEIKILPKQTYL